jgi:thioredoxin 1
MASPLISSTSAQTFQSDVLESPIPVVVHFWAVWSGPSRTVGVYLDGVAAEFEGRAKIFKIDVDREQEITTQYGVRSVPTVILFKGGAAVDRLVGNPGSKAKVKEFIARNL